MSRPAPRLIVALDNCTASEARALVSELSAANVTWFKVGLELYTQVGPEFVRELKGLGHQVFLDLKLHDIPNTVAKAVKAAEAIGADLLTVHASGGHEMLEAAQDAAAGSKLSVLAVTVLTSLAEGPFDRVCSAWGVNPEEPVARRAVVVELARLAAAAGLPGIVCSAADLQDDVIRKLPWQSGGPLLVTPGIRNAGDAVNDQKAVATVAQAVARGSTHLVVGRPITAPAKGTRASAATEFLRQISEAKATDGHATHS